MHAQETVLDRYGNEYPTVEHTDNCRSCGNDTVVVGHPFIYWSDEFGDDDPDDEPYLEGFDQSFWCSDVFCDLEWSNTAEIGDEAIYTPTCDSATRRGWVVKAHEHSLACQDAARCATMREAELTAWGY